MQSNMMDNREEGKRKERDESKGKERDEREMLAYRH